MSDQPLFLETGPGVFTPDLLARGPFEGMQGGAVAALMCAAIERSVTGQVASVTTHFLRPAPVAPLTVRVTPLRAGRRVSVIDAEVSGPGGVLAVQRATVITPAPPQPWPVPPPRRSDPERADLRVRTAPHGGPWLMDAMEVREADGVFWFRQRRPVVAGAGPMAAVLPAADWAHGLVPPLGCERRPEAAAIPNPEMTAHLIRPACCAWIGVEPATAWSEASIGAGWAALHDTEGLIGRVAMAVAVTALETAMAG